MAKILIVKLRIYENIFNRNTVLIVTYMSPRPRPRRGRLRGWPRRWPPPSRSAPPRPPPRSRPATPALPPPPQLRRS